MLKDNGWFDWAIQDPGPEDRILSSLQLPLVLVVHHSMEGVYNYPGGYTALRDPNRKPTAWQWSVERDGQLLQHYGAFKHLQHGHAANVLGPGGESEGFYYEPLTPEQVASWRRIHSDINEYRERKGLPPLTRNPERLPQATKRGWVEHREMAPAYNTTQCPSERYAPLWASYEEDDMTPAEVEAIVNKRLDDVLPAYYRSLTRGYWDRNAPGAYTDPPDPEVVAGIALEALPDHSHYMPDQATETGGVTG